MIRKVLLVTAGCLVAGSAYMVASGRLPRDNYLVPNETIGHLPGHMEDFLRIVVMGLAGMTLGLLFLISNLFRKIKLDVRDKFVKPLAWLSFSYFCLTLFASLEMISKLGVDYLTWRTPLAFASFAVSVFSLYQLLARLNYATVLARSTDATIRVGLLDTGKPGPDIDLQTQEPVENHPLASRETTEKCPKCQACCLREAADGVRFCPICSFSRRSNQ